MYLENYIDQITKLCEYQKVKLLFAFGSVLETRFSESSDIDLVVDFQTADPLEYAENYFALKFSLQELLERPRNGLHRPNELFRILVEKRGD